MAATYGYGGEFSSDEDLDRSEQQQHDRANKFDSVKPTRDQIEATIWNIRKQPNDDEIQLTDDMLVGILDRYRTPRGPIVDSTRKIYKKIIIKLIRDQPEDGASTNSDNQQKSPTNGNGTTTNGGGEVFSKSGLSINNNDLSLLSKRQPAFEAASSDEDEPMPPVSQEPVFIDNNNKDAEPMEVDPVQTVPLSKSPQMIELNTTDDEASADDNDDDDDDSKTESSSEESEADNGLDMTANEQGDKPKTHFTSTPILQFKVTPKRAELAQRKGATKESAKKSTFQAAPEVQTPYRRSQRVAATRLNKSPTNKGDQAVGSTVRAMGAVRAPKSIGMKKSMMKFMVVAILVGLMAYLIYYFKSDILNSTRKMMYKVDIKF